VAPGPKSRRKVYFAEAGGYVDCAIYDRYALGAAAQLAGPAVVEELDSTTVVHPRYGLRVDGHGNLIIEEDGLRNRDAAQLFGVGDQVDFEDPAV
jgi:N-methylhydantoinase A